MSTKTTFISSIIINFLLISCGSSKQTTYPVKFNDETKQSISTVLNMDNKLGYTITRDNSHMYITVNTQDRVIQLKMLRNGVTIFFDNEGKKNKNLSVQYPTKRRQALDIEKIKKMRENGNRQEMLQKMMSSLGTDIKITDYGEERIINKELNNDGIFVDHKISIEGLSYTLKVPLSYIKSQSDIKSIGISIEGMKRPDGNTKRLSMGGRPSGGLRGAGGMLGGMKGNRTNLSQLKEMLSDINIWIPIELK